MECVICHETMKSVHTLECGHSFHVPCIISWFRSGKGNCPLCRDEAICHPIRTSKLQYLQKLSQMNSCPLHIKQVHNDYMKEKTVLSELKKKLKGKKGRNTKELRRSIHRQEVRLSDIKNYINQSHVLIIPVSKTIFETVDRST